MLSDPSMEESFNDDLMFREFAKRSRYTRPLDKASIHQLRGLPQAHRLGPQISRVVNDLPSAEGLLLRAVKVGQPWRAVASRRVSSAACQGGTCFKNKYYLLSFMILCLDRPGCMQADRASRHTDQLSQSHHQGGSSP